MSCCASRPACPAPRALWGSPCFLVCGNVERTTGLERLGPGVRVWACFAPAAFPRVSLRIDTRRYTGPETARAADRGRERKPQAGRKGPTKLRGES
jgi:hypothetical protein